MARFHLTNPLDTLFLAIDEAWRRCGFPGAEIHWYLELKGELDVPGLRRALRALYRIYPVLQGRLSRRRFTGRPVWRLDAEPPVLENAVDLRRLDPPTELELHQQIEQLLSSRLDLKTRPPLQFTVFRGLPSGDFLVMRWPHGLMDAHGGATVVRTLIRLYEERPDPETLVSVGDENRTDFGVLSERTPLLRYARMLVSRGDQATPPRDWEDVRLSDSASTAGGRLRFYVRKLSREEYGRVRATSMQVCGFARVSDFVRACAIRALHETLGSSPSPKRGYSTMLLVDNRRRRDPTPVCHNVFSTLPVFVPTTLAADRRKVADLVRDAAARTLTEGLLERRLAGIRMLARVPMNVLVAAMTHELRTGRSLLPIGVSRPPSLPMTFMHLFPRPLKSFCNAELVNLYGTRPGIPADGMVVNVSTAQERMTISGIHFEPLVTRQRMDRFLDRFVAALTDPD